MTCEEDLLSQVWAATQRTVHGRAISEYEYKYKVQDIFVTQVKPATSRT